MINDECTAPSGYVADTGDCDDTDAAYSPGATPCCDGDDYDCDGSVDNDGDGDGYADDAGGGDDCDDADAAVVPDPAGGCALGTDCDDILTAPPAAARPTASTPSTRTAGRPGTPPSTSPAT